MRSFELKPIEVAVEEMTNKCKELEEIVTADVVDIKKLQLRLQGSVNVQVTVLCDVICRVVPFYVYR